MWIKSLDRNVWVSMKHVTHFSVQTGESFEKSDGVVRVITPYFAYAFLDTSSLRSNYRLSDLMKGKPSQKHHIVEDQARIPVCKGTKDECEQFIKDKTFLQSAYEWIGYVVAGGVGAILTLIFT